MQKLNQWRNIVGKDSKLGINGVWIIAVFLLVIGYFFWYEDANAAEFEIGPALLSGEYSEGGTLIFTERVGKWSLGGGYVSEQYCHCTWPTSLKENIFFQGQRIVEHKKFEIGLGAAYFQNTNRALGKNLTWALSLGYGGEHLSVRFRHYSNAGSGSPNLGQDMVTLGYNF
jgi:hypothetical protein